MKALHKERMQRFVEAGLYVATSESASAGRDTIGIVRACLAAGVKLIQLREKELPTGDFYKLALKVRSLTERSDALFLVNDHFEIALAVKADGAHLGQDDLPTHVARKLAPDMIIGASSSCLSEALASEREGASYVNIGPVYPTTTKAGCEDGVGVRKVAAIGRRLSIPFTVMGGIKLQHIPELIKAGASSIAVISAITAAPNPKAAATTLLKEIVKARLAAVAFNECRRKTPILK